MAATVSLTNHRLFQPVWPGKLREDQKTPIRNSARKRGANANLPMEYIDPGRAELRSVLVRTHAVMHRTNSGQNYEKAVKVVNAEYWKPPKTVPGEWFPNVGQAFDLRKGSADAVKVNHFCDMLEEMPFLFKAIDRIKISWLRNNYPLPLRIVRALDRDDFELISSNFGSPIGDVNRHPGAMWLMSTESPKVTARRPTRRGTTGRYSRPFDRSALVTDPSAVPKSVVPHRREWNRLVHRYLDDCVAALEPAVEDQLNRMASVGAGRDSLTGAEGPATAETETAADTARWPAGRPPSRLMEPLHPPWQLVEEAEQGDRRVCDLSTVCADDARLIMKRCRQLKSTALSQMDQLYKAKIHKLEDNREQRFRRRVSCLAPPYRTAEQALPALRRRVRRRSRLEDVTLRCAAWYGRLLRLADRLGAVDTQRCQQLLERLQPYSRQEGRLAARGSEKLCLLLMSVPVYDALRDGLQMAVLFVHVHFLGGSENVFRRWLEARSMPDATKNSPLIGLLREEVVQEDDDFSSSEDESS